MKLLVTADMHLGQRPRRVASELAAACSCTRMWQAIVQTAIELQVQAVVLVGDVVDEDNRFYEALGPLELGVRELAGHHISVVTVTGNHDYEVLPRLIDQAGIESWHLLGREGTWERLVLNQAGRPALQLFGWSFPQRQVAVSPLPAFPRGSVDAGVPALGLIHGDLDVADSPYCPLRRAEFAATGVGVWALGHVHKPSVLTAGESPIVFYPGSPQGMDMGVGERGPHGPWLLTWTAGGVQASMVPLAPLRYEALSVALSGVDSEPALQASLVGSMRDAVARVEAVQDNLQALVVRLLVQGRSPLTQAQVRRQVELLQQEVLHVGKAEIVVESAEIALRPMIDLAALAREPSLIGVLAQLVTSLEDGSPPDADTAALLVRAHERLMEVAAHRQFTPLAHVHTREPAPSDDTSAVRDQLAGLAWRLLDDLIAEREAPHG